MRILVVNNLYPPVVFGGYEILCQQVVARLKELGHEIEVLTSNFRAKELIAEEGVYRKLALTTNFPLPGEDVGSVDFSLKALHRVSVLNEPAIEWRLREFRPEIIFCWCLSRLSLAPVWVAQRKGVPVCYTVNDEHTRQYKYAQLNSMKNALKWLRERCLYPKATLSLARRFPIACISQALKNKLLAQGTQIEHAKVIYQGIPLEKFPYQPTPYESGPFQLLYVGQISETKGVHTLLKALSEVNQKSSCQVQLRVVGSGVPKYQSYLEVLAAELGIEDQVRFLGRVDHQEVSGFYRASHGFVFPSEWDEPFGLTHLEAMASGAAVISTTTGGSAELIRHRENALAFEAGCAEELAQQIILLATDEMFRNSLIERARNYVEENHSIDVYARNLETFLKRTCADDS
jgi:glycogen synthase